MCTTPLVGGFLMEMLKYFEFMFNMFEFSHV